MKSLLLMLSVFQTLNAILMNEHLSKNVLTILTILRLIEREREIMQNEKNRKMT